MAPSREAEDVVFEAEAALRRQEADIEEVLAAVAAAQVLAERARAELDREAADATADREEEEKDARTGALGPSRQELQKRLDRDETTWRDVLTGRDTHRTAEAYREEIGRVVGQVVEQESAADPEFRKAFELMECHHGLEDPPVAFSDWPQPPTTTSDETTPDPADPPSGPGPATSFGTW